MAAEIYIAPGKQSFAKADDGSVALVTVDYLKALFPGASAGSLVATTGTAGILEILTLGTNLAIASGTLNASGGISFSDVTTTYTSAGAIATTDTLAVINSAAAVTMTLTAGSTTVLQIDIHNRGSGIATINATIDGEAGSEHLATGATVTLRWLPSLSTWIIM